MVCLLSGRKEHRSVEEQSVCDDLPPWRSDGEEDRTIVGLSALRSATVSTLMRLDLDVSREDLERELQEMDMAMNKGLSVHEFQMWFELQVVPLAK